MQSLVKAHCIWSWVWDLLDPYFNFLKFHTVLVPWLRPIFFLGYSNMGLQPLEQISSSLYFTHKNYLRTTLHMLYPNHWNLYSTFYFVLIYCVWNSGFENVNENTSTMLVCHLHMIPVMIFNKCHSLFYSKVWKTGWEWCRIGTFWECSNKHFENGWKSGCWRWCFDKQPVQSSNTTGGGRWTSDRGVWWLIGEYLWDIKLW